jgi:predicted DNA-binding transcriptional regulator YafY
MKSTPPRRRPAVQITLARAARLHRLVSRLAERARSREAILSELAIGLRTFYRELELLKRCGVKVRHKDKVYVLHATAEQAEGRLPFPDPQLSFAEMAELSRHPGEAAKRLAELLDRVINAPPPPKKGGRGRKGAKPRGSGDAQAKT